MTRSNLYEILAIDWGGRIVFDFTYQGHNKYCISRPPAFRSTPITHPFHQPISSRNRSLHLTLFQYITLEYSWPPHHPYSLLISRALTLDSTGSWHSVPKLINFRRPTSPPQSRPSPRSFERRTCSRSSPQGYAQNIWNCDGCASSFGGIFERNAFDGICRKVDQLKLDSHHKINKIIFMWFKHWNWSSNWKTRTPSSDLRLQTQYSLRSSSARIRNSLEIYSLLARPM